MIGKKNCLLRGYYKGVTIAFMENFGVTNLLKVELLAFSELPQFAFNLGVRKLEIHIGCKVD